MGPKRPGPNTPLPDPPDRVGTPEKYAVPPPRSLQVDDQWTIDHLIELEKSVASLTQTVAHLQSALGEQKQELKILSRTIWIATGVFLTVSAIGSAALVIFGRQLWDVLSQMEELLRHAPKP